MTTSKKDGLTRLLEKQEEEIENINNKIEIWKKYRNEYQDLKKLIDTIKDKVRHPYKIPIAGSKLALVDGHIIHTNEITVLLGYNYFSLRSASQANQIIIRRLENIKTMIKKSEEAKKKTEDWLKVASDHKREKEEFVEIVETMWYLHNINFYY